MILVSSTRPMSCPPSLGSNYLWFLATMGLTEITDLAFQDIRDWKHHPHAYWFSVEPTWLEFW